MTGGLPVRSDLHDLPVAAEHRSFILHVPRSYRADRPTPLVILLHGHGAKAAAFERSTGMSAKAEKESFIVAYPQALGSPSVWHTAVDGSPHGDDVAFIATLIDSVSHVYNIDPARIYVGGHSNGPSWRIASARCYRRASRRSGSRRAPSAASPRAVTRCAFGSRCNRSR